MRAPAAAARATAKDAVEAEGAGSRDDVPKAREGAHLPAVETTEWAAQVSDAKDAPSA